MANKDKYNLEERLKSTRSKATAKPKTSNSSRNDNAKHGISQDDPYNLQERLYGHKDRSTAVALGAQRRVTSLNEAKEKLFGNDLYQRGASSNAALDDGIDKLITASGSALRYYNQYPEEFGEELEGAKALDEKTWAEAVGLQKPILARQGFESVLNNVTPGSEEYRMYKRLLSLAQKDQNVDSLMSQSKTNGFEELYELSKNFNLQDALLTVEDYYRGLYTPVMADGLSAAKVDRADYAKAASDIERFTGIDVRGLKPEEVEQKLTEIGDMSDTVDWMQNYMRWENERRDAEAALGNWQEDFTKNWGGLRDAPDYDELSRVEKKKAPFWARNEYSDKDYMHPNEVYPAQAFPETYSGVFDYMTEEQLRDFTYLYNQPDDGEAQARAYIEALAPDLLRRRAEDQVQKAEEFASRNGLTGTAAFVAARGANLANSIVGATDMLTTPFRAAAGLVDPSVLENDPNSIQYDYLRYAQALDQANVQNIAEATEGLNIAGINIPSQIYSGVASGADSLAAGLMYGPVASAALGANAYSSARFEDEDMLDAGMQALFEGLTEKYSLDSMFSDTGSIVKSIAKNMLVEPTEELANMALNIGWDRLRYGENGEIGTRFNELRAKGYDEHDASVQIASEYGREALATVISSAFAGAFGGAVGGTMAAVEDNTTGSNLQSNNAEKSMLDLAVTLPLPEDIMKVAQEQLGAVTNGAKTSAAKIGRVFREMIKAVDEQTQSVLEATMTRNVNSMLKANGVNEAGMAEAVTRIVAGNGAATPEDYQRVGANDKALSLTEGLISTYEGGKQLNEKAARIAEQAAKKGQKQEQTEVADTVTDIENEPVNGADELAVADEEITAEAARQMVQESAAEYGANADIVAAAYEEGQDPVAFSSQFRKAYEYGEEGRNFDIISKSDSFSGLKPQQIEKAYTMGRGARVFKAEQAAKNRSGIVPVGNIDTTEIRGMKLNESQRSSTRAISKLAQAAGFNVRFIASTANEEGKFTGKNGSWDKATRTITIDVNAGRVSTSDANYAMMQTAGHELTHFIKDFADTELFGQYQDFVFGHLSEKMDEAALDSKVSEYIERWAKAGKTIDRDGAIEEIVADASGDALLKMTDADILQLSEQNPSLLKKIGDFIKRWVADVKILIQKAYKGQTARNAIAEQMADAADELGKRWNELLKNAAQSARETAAEQAESVSEAKENQSSEAGKFLAYQARAGVEFIPDKYYDRLIDNIDEQKDGSYLRVGAIQKGSVLNRVGIPDVNLYFDVSKIRTAMSEHADHIRSEVLKQIPNILRDPIVIAEANVDNTINVFGDLWINDSPVMVGVMIAADRSGKNIISKVRTVHARRDYMNKITDKNVLYMNEDKKRTRSWFQARGNVVPLGGNKFGFIRSIAQDAEDVKFSMRAPVDQTNTPEFRNWFKGSKIVNADGTPKVMYHGSPNDFTVFDIKKAKSSGLYGKGFYFTDSASHGGTYGKLYEVYLSIQNPLTPDGSTVTRTQVRKFLEAVAENEDDYSIENYGTYDVNEILRGVYRKDAFAVIQDVSATAIGDMVEAVKLFNEVNGTTFDGIVVDTETVAFEPTQIKSATDNIGTFDPENPDMRFQLRDPDQISDRALLANVMESAATNEVELDFVRRYREQIDQLNEKQAQLDETNQAIMAARKAGKRADAAALQNKADILAKQIGRMDGQLLKFEAGKPLQAVVKREREALRRRANERTKARVEEVRKKEAEYRKTKLKELRDRKNESFGRQKYLKQVNEATAKLRAMVTTPTNKEHVPQFLRKPLGEFLNVLDFTSKRQLEGGDPTNADMRLADAAAALRNAIGKISKQQSGLDISGEEFFNGYLDLPSNYIEEFDLLMTKVRAAIKAAPGLDDTPINKMKSSDLHDLAVCLRTLQISINKMNRLLSNAQFAHADDASRTTIAELDKFKAKKEQNKLMQKAMDFFDWKNTTPYYAFKRFGRGGQAIFESLQNGWDKLAFHADELVKFTEKAYKVEEVREWDKQIEQVELTSGETVKLTTSQLMSLYCLAKREQALGHMMGGGIRIATIDGKRGKSVVQGENYILSEADIETFRKQLTDRQREVADILQKDMVKRGAEWGNEISMKRFGYEMFTEENYFPVESDRNNMSAKDPGAHENSLLRLLNMSATKDLTKGANNAIVVRGIFDVYTTHMSDMAKYNALALPILDAMKWLNYVERTQDDKGKITTSSVQKSLELTYGEEARRYIMEFIKNLNGETEGGRDEVGIGKLTSNYKIAAVGANLRVGLLQITSMPRAAVVISPKHLLSGIMKWNSRKGMSKAATDKVGIAKWKSMGFYDTNISRNMRQMIKHDESGMDKARGWSMKFAEWGDAWTMGVLYGAVESELMQTMESDTEEFDRKLNERMREIIYRTQVVDSTMTRSHLMRQKNISGLMSFMSEPTLAMNMLNDTLFDLRMNSRSADGTKWNPAASKTLAKVFVVSVVTTGIASVIEALSTAYRDDDEYEEFGEKFMEAWIGNYSDAETFYDRWKAFWEGSIGSNINPLGSIPVISDVVDAWKSGAATQMWQEFLGDLSGGIAALSKAIREDGSLADYYGASYKILNGLSRMSGLPASAVSRELVAFYNSIIAEPMGWRRLQTYDNSKSEAAASVLTALTEGNTERAAYVRERAALYGIEEKDLNESLATRVNAAYLKGEVDRDTADQLLTDEAGKRSRQAEETLTKADYQLKTGLKYSEMKENFIDGTITEEKAREYLKDYDGLRKDEIDAKIGEWQYEKETGLPYGSMKDDFIDGVLTESQVRNYRKEYGGADDDDVDTTLGKWKYERDTGLAYSEMKLDYADGVITESQARSYLSKYGLKDEEQVEESISNFDYYVSTGRTTTAPKYWRIAYAFDSGTDYGAYIDEAFDNIMYGGEKRKSRKQARSQIASSLASYYKNQYLAAYGTAAGEAMLERILDLYEAIGYTRSYQRKYIEENWFED